MAGVATVIVGAMSLAVHMTSPAMNMGVRLQRHKSYSTRVTLVSAVIGLGRGSVKS
jgi:hypothetical protein